MRVPAKLAILCAAALACATPALCDEIRLKDGKKLYGVIVGYEDNMFRVKTGYGFVLVEKDKIASIVPTGSGTESSASAAKPTAKPAAKPATTQSASARAAASATDSGMATNNAESVAAPAKPRISADPVRPALPANVRSSSVTPPTIRPSVNAASAPLATSPKGPEPPVNREEVQGTLYVNYSHGFRMYKAPSWEIIEDARKALPNAIVAMGTSNESTLMVVGQEQTKESLDAAANTVEKRMREIYSNYRMVSRRKTVVGGAPAVEFKYSGKADEHEWSGTLAVIGRGSDVLTILGMTYADSDLIQIQENVIARAIASTSFDLQKLSAEK